MQIDIGHEAGLDLDESSGTRTYVPIEGKQVTTLVIPDGMSPQEAMPGVLEALAYQIQDEHQPAWIESDNDAMKLMLCGHYGVDPKKKRPKTWSPS